MLSVIGEGLTIKETMHSWPLVLDDIDHYADAMLKGDVWDQHALEEARQWLLSKLKSYMVKYENYFKRQNARYRAETGLNKTALDSLPRVVLVPGMHNWFSACDTALFNVQP